LVSRQPQSVFFGYIDASDLSELNQFAFDHLLSQIDQNVEDAKIALLQSHLKRLHIQPVTRKHAAMIAPFRVGGGAATASVRVAGRARPKKRRKFSEVAAATSSGDKFLTLASVRATSATYAGSLRLPRQGCGARYGESVSIKILSTGKAFAMSRRFCGFG